MRTRVLASLGALAPLAFCACTSREQDPRTIYNTEVAIGGELPAQLARTLDPGAYLVEVREQDIDLRLSVDGAGPHSDAEDEVPRHGTLHKVVSVGAPGELRLTIGSADHRGKQGKAAVRIARWKRPVTAPADELELGYAALAAAGEFDAQKTPATSQDAADKLYEAISHFEKARADGERAQASYTLGNLLYNARDDFAGAIRAADVAVDAYDDLDDPVGVQNASTLRAAAEIELAGGMDASKQRAEQAAMYEDADRRLREAAEFFGKNGLPVRAAYAVNMRGIRALNLGNYELAATLFEQAVAMARANQDVGEQARYLANLAWAHNRRGFIAQAAAEYEALLPLVEKDRQPYQYAGLLNNYGFCLIALGDFDRALALHNEALELYTAMGRERERATELAALGGLYFRIGDTQRALDVLRAAIAAQERVGETIGQASSLRVAGNAASTLGRHDEALAFLRKSAQIDANKTSAARTRVLIAGELLTLGDLRGAEAELTSALAAGNSLVNANALEERARLRAAQNKPAAAIEDLRAADREYRALGLDFNRIETSTALSRALLTAGDMTGASAAADEAVSITGRIRVKSANPEWRAQFLSAQYSPYEARIAADFAGNGKDGAWRAFRTAELIKARSLADQLAHEPERTTSDAKDDGLRATLTSLQMRLETRTQRLGAEDPETIELRRAVEEARARLEESRTAVTARVSSLSEEMAAVQATLPRDTAVLAFFVGDHDSYAWLLTHETLRHKKLPGLHRLEKEIEAAVSAQQSGAGVTAALANTLLAGLLDGATATRLLVIPDGPLNGVPFAALQTRPGELLIDRFVLGYAPSLTLAMQAPKREPARHERVAVVSDPVYAADDRRLQLALGANGGTLRGPREASPNNLTRLPYSALEARAVLRAVGSKDAIALEGFNATPARVLALPAGDLAVLHFATHALARRDSPEQSALYLSEYTEDGKLVPDSRITADEIARSGLHADVVVLSGCATGDGSELRGEGVLGLTYGFLANGSRAVVASLWPIEDASTARFMSEFYGAYREKAHPAEALRTAQLRMRDVAAAAVWSSFVVRANGFP